MLNSPHLLVARDKLSYLLLDALPRSRYRSFYRQTTLRALFLSELMPNGLLTAIQEEKHPACFLKVP